MSKNFGSSWFSLFGLYGIWAGNDNCLIMLDFLKKSVIINEFLTNQIDNLQTSLRFYLA